MHLCCQAERLVHMLFPFCIHQFVATWPAPQLQDTVCQFGISHIKQLVTCPMRTPRLVLLTEQTCAMCLFHISTLCICIYNRSALAINTGDMRVGLLCLWLRIIFPILWHTSTSEQSSGSHCGHSLLCTLAQQQRSARLHQSLGIISDKQIRKFRI